MSAAESVKAEQRFSKSRPCPICQGHPAMQRGKGERCAGYLSSDGKYAHCTREEHAGSLTATEAETFAHRIEGPCKCGVQHREAIHETRSSSTAVYTYHDEQGRPLFRVNRKPGKEFPQEHYTATGEWKWGRGGARRVLYRLPELLAADKSAIVFIVEGEKDVDTLRRHGATATTNPEGSGKWNLVDGCKQEALRGRHVVVLADADKPGRNHATTVERWCREVCASVRTIDLYPDRDDGADVSDWIGEGNTLADLMALVDAMPASEKSAGDPWQAELDKALDDVKAKLGVGDTSTLEPLFDGCDVADLLKREFTKPPWLVTGLVTKGGITMIGAEPKAAKTWLGTEISIGVATGTKVCGEFFAEHGVVAYFYAEDLDRQVKNRIRALLAGRGVGEFPRGRLHARPRGRFIDVMEDSHMAQIVASVRRIGQIDLLVLDPLRDIHSAEEDKSDKMSPVMRRLRALAEILGCTVAVVHHAPKATKENKSRRAGQNLRGSGAIHGAVDSGIYLTDSGGNGTDLFTNTVESQIKGARSAGKFKLELRVEDDAEGEAVRAVWQHSKIEAGTKSETRVVAEADKQEAARYRMCEYVERLAREGIHLSMTGLRDHREGDVRASPASHAKTPDILKECIELEWLELRGGFVYSRRGKGDVNA